MKSTGTTGIPNSNETVFLQKEGLTLQIQLKHNRASLYYDSYKESDRPFLSAQLVGAPAMEAPTKVVPPYRAVIKAGAVKSMPASLTFQENILTASFTDVGDVRIWIQMHAQFVIFRVLSCPEQIERLYFGGIFCPECRQGCSSVSMSLNLHTNCDDLLSISAYLGACAFRDFGIEGASFAAVCCKEDALRHIMRQITSEYTEDIPWSSKAGAFSIDHEDVRNSYLMNTRGISPDTVDYWILLAHKFGAKQIDFHGGYTFRFGDLRPNPALFPNGKEDFAKVIDRLHQAGLQAGLHTYAQFIQKDSSYVTPIPHPDLGGNPFTLSQSVDADATSIPVLESTAGISTKTGFFVRNSTYLLIDQEILEFDAVGENEFIICKRGALGTTPSSHTAQSRIKHLFSVFGHFAPDPESTLYLEVARNTAAAYNELGFDMIYLDAIDGSDVFAGGDKAWYYSALFVAEILRNTKRPPILEMSAMWHHFWYFRTRMGAWDHSNRAHKYLLGEHNRSNLRTIEKTLLPQNYGWWNYQKADPHFPIQVRREFIDDYEFWAGNALKNDWSLSFIPGGDGKLTDEMSRFADVIGSFDRYRLANASMDFGNISNSELMFCDGRPIPVTYQKQLTYSENRQTLPFPEGRQLKRLRVENRPFPVKDQKGPVLFCAEHADSIRLLASKNVTASLEPCSNELSSMNPSFMEEKGCVPKNGMRLTASQAGTFGYARMERIFPEPTDLSQAPGLYITICGDGKGELVNIQLKSPKHILGGTLDRVIDIDFVGWKCFKLIESDAHRLEENYWPFSGGGHYNQTDHDPLYEIAQDTELSQYEWHPSCLDLDIYYSTREKVTLSDLYSISVWMNNMKEGETYSITVGEISAFPIQRQPLCDPCICIDGQEYAIKGTLPTDSYIEYDNGTWYGYDVEGNLLTDIVYPRLPDTVTANSPIKITAKGEYGAELTIGTSEQ